MSKPARSASSIALSGSVMTQTYPAEAARASCSQNKKAGESLRSRRPNFYALTVGVSRERLPFGALRLRSDARFLDVGQTTAHVHEAAALGALRLATAGGMGREARACRDEPADDHVFLQAAQVVLQAAHGCFRQHASGLLERRRRNERLRGQRRLGD